MVGCSANEGDAAGWLGRGCPPAGSLGAGRVTRGRAAMVGCSASGVFGPGRVVRGAPSGMVSAGGGGAGSG